MPLRTRQVKSSATRHPGCRIASIAQGASKTILHWLGTMHMPTALVEFCIVTLVIRVAGVPFKSTENAPVMCLDRFIHGLRLKRHGGSCRAAEPVAITGDQERLTVQAQLHLDRTL